MLNSIQRRICRTLPSSARKAALIGLCGLLGLMSLSSATKLYAQGDRPSLVGTDTVIKATSAQTESFIGQVVATRRGIVASRLAGLVSKLNVQIGDQVEAGEVIAEIDIDNVLAQRDVAARQLDQASAGLEASEAQLGLARQERERLEKLQGTASVSQSRYDDALQNEVILAARIREARASREVAESSLRLAEIDLNHGQIRAPYSGYVVNRLTELGSFLGVGHSVVELIGNEAMEIEVDVRFDRLAEIQPGTELSVSLATDARDGLTFKARIRAILPRENPRTRSRTVRLQPVDALPFDSVADGQSVDVLIPVSAQREMISLHKDAVVRRGDKVIVYVVEEGVAKLKPVTLGIAIGDRFEILTGLVPGEMVVVRGNERLRPDAKVKVINGGGGNAGKKPDAATGNNEASKKERVSKTEMKAEMKPEQAADQPSAAESASNAPTPARQQAAPPKVENAPLTDASTNASNADQGDTNSATPRQAVGKPVTR